VVVKLVSEPGTGAAWAGPAPNSSAPAAAQAAAAPAAAPRNDREEIIVAQLLPVPDADKQTLASYFPANNRSTPDLCCELFNKHFIAAC
jgi:hypothetical protein